MELVLLRRLVSELDERLRGGRIDQVYALPRYHLALVFGLRGTPRLWYSAEPDEPHLYLRHGSHPTAQRPPAFAMAVRKHARGRRLESVRLLREDRVVELRWSGSKARLVLELVPRRATALVLDSSDRVVAVWNPRRGRPGVGSVYTPPERRERTAADQLVETDWNRIAATGEPSEVRRSLQRTVAGVSRSIAGEIVLRWQSGEPIGQAAADELLRAGTSPTEPTIYSPAPLPELTSQPSAGRLLLAPYPLPRSCPGHATRFDTLIEAAETYYRQRARLRMLDRSRAAIGTAIRTRRARLARARDRVAAHPDADSEPDALRRLGDLLLAHPEAEIQGGHALVPDDYGDGSILRIRLDPKLDRVTNAQRLYRRAKRLERKARHDAARRVEIDGLVLLADEALEDLQKMVSAAERERILQRVAALGVSARSEHLRASEASSGTQEESHSSRSTGKAKAPGPGIRLLILPDGSEVLVGRSASGNDRLTHRLAAPHDWWLHAEGPGSHVVLRNRHRTEQPPTHALHAAACIAAWFSKARGAARVEVRWTRAADVRRARQGPAGTAILERYKSLRVRPQSPQELSRNQSSDD